MTAPRFAPPRRGNLLFADDTWKIIDPDREIPPAGVLSNCAVEPRPSEYEDDSMCKPCAWWSRSLISFDYRVVEVPPGKLLDPGCDALIFGHLEVGSEQRAEAMKKPQRRLVVIDATVHELYGEQVKKYFEARGVAHQILPVRAVEENKSVELTLEIAKAMKKFNIDRRTEPVIAIGGGVCLDVVGLAASLFRRRTPYIRVPTTALSYVDASVGAKNGCNFCESKNRLGTYVPPVAALLDSSFFKTQRSRDISNSLGEMCKMAIMKSSELLGLLEGHGQRLIEGRVQPESASDEVPARVLRISIQTMLEELAPNLWEESLDRLVDFGHAVGQVLEMDALGTEHELMHGEAVAVDMAFMTVLSQGLGNISEAERDRILSVLRGCSLPVWSPLFDRAFLKRAVADRVKNSMGQRLPLPVGIGKARIFSDVTDEALEKGFQKWQELCAPASDAVPRAPAAAAASVAAGKRLPTVQRYVTFPPAPNALMVDIFLREKGIGTDEIQRLEHFIDLPSLENRNAEYLAQNPQGSLPWFVLEDGTVIAETIAMCEYVEEVMGEPTLIGKTPKERGVVRQWQRRMEEHYVYPAFYGHRNWTASTDCPEGHFMKDFFAGRLNAHFGAHMLPEAWKDLCTWARNRIQWLERVKTEEAAQGKATEFIAGDRFSVVDIQVYVTLWFFSDAFPNPPQRILQDLEGSVPWMQAWYDRVHSRPACVAARQYREENMRSRPTAQSGSPAA